eukprot:12347556-Alexandrium_andersonii.AAC.1
MSVAMAMMVMVMVAALIATAISRIVAHSATSNYSTPCNDGSHGDGSHASAIKNDYAGGSRIT